MSAERQRSFFVHCVHTRMKFCGANYHTVSALELEKDHEILVKSSLANLVYSSSFCYNS